MLRRPALILPALLLLWSLPVRAESWDVRHQRPVEHPQGQPLLIELEVMPRERVSYVVVYGMGGTADRFRPVVVREIDADGSYRAVLPPDLTSGGELRYFLRVVDVDGASHDVVGSQARPVRVMLTTAPDESQAAEIEAAVVDSALLVDLTGLDLSGLSALEAEFQLLQVEDVVISAARYTQSIIEAPAAIYVLSRDDLMAFGFRDPAAALRFVPGVHVATVNEATPLVGVRGFLSESNNLVLFLEQGRELNVELFGSAFLANQSFTMDDLERIEIIRGPGSALYGANAYSGVVQFIPRRPGAFERRFRLLVDSDVIMGGHRAEYRAAGVTDAVQYRVSGQYREDRSASDTSDRALRKAATRARLGFEQWPVPVQVDVGVSQLQGEIYTILGETPTDMFASELAVSSQLGPVRALLYWNHWDAEMGVADDILAARLPRIEWNTDTLNLDLMADIAFGTIDRLTVGGNLRWNRFASPQLASGVTSEVRAGVFLQNELRPWEHFILNVGVRSDFSTLYLPEGAIGDRLTLSPRASAIFPVNDDHGIRLSYGTAFRKPSFFEQSARFEALVPTNENVSNPDLVNEQVLTGELGYTGRAAGLRWGVDLFYNVYRDFIDFKNVRYENQDPDVDGSTTSLGGELSVRYRIMDGLAVFANYAYLQITLDRPDPLAEGQPLESLPRRSSPQHLANAGVRYGKETGAQAALAMHWQSEFTGRFINPEAGSILLGATDPRPIEAYLNVFARAGWRFSNWEVGLIGEQLQSDRHQEFPGVEGVPTPENIAPRPAGTRYGGESVPPRAFLYVEGHF